MNLRLTTGNTCYFAPGHMEFKFFRFVRRVLMAAVTRRNLPPLADSSFVGRQLSRYDVLHAKK